MAFSNAARVRICRGTIPLRTNSTIRWPVANPRCLFLESPARAVAHPGSDMPSVSVRQAMVFAV
jgi:hypothetical protein